MKKIQDGDYVSVHYTGKLPGGEVFDSSHGKKPLEIQVGAGAVIPGFDNALRGMGENESKKFTLDPEEAYGQRDENMERSFLRTDLPEGMDPKVGDTLALKTPSGEQVPVWVSESGENEIKIDMNHPLAGKTLTFEIQVMTISDTPNQAQSCGAGCSC
jgi:peptidylprolyl isomerase